MQLKRYFYTRKYVEGQSLEPGAINVYYKNAFCHLEYKPLKRFKIRSADMPQKEVNIPDFMSEPKKVITLAEEDLTNFIEREARVRVERFNCGFRYGLALGLLITVIAIIAFILFTPMNLLLA